MTRREFVALSIFPASSGTLTVPVRHVFDKRAKFTADRIRYFHSVLWAEAARDLARCGIRLDTTSTEGEIRRSPSGRPIFTGLCPGAINLVVTDYVPLDWDGGRGLSGVTTRYESHHVCLVALMHAHTHRIPFVAVNTCVHELLHAMMHDIFKNRPRGLAGAVREFRVDWYATRLWLFHEGILIRRAAEAYVERLRSTAAGAVCL